MSQPEFWNQFANEADDLLDRFLSGETRSVFDRIESVAIANDIHCCFDVTSDGTFGHLIFSPEGDHEVARQIDAFLSIAPAIPNWKVFGRRQQRPLHDVRSHILECWYLDPLECAYQILYDRDVRTVQMSIPDDPYEMTDTEKQGLIDTFLWHAVGEHFVMENEIRGKVLVAAAHCCLSAHDMIAELTGIRPE